MNRYWKAVSGKTEKDRIVTEPLKIAMLSIHSCPIGELGAKDTGGMSVYIRELGRELGRLGHEIDVFTRRHNTSHEPVTTLEERIRLIHLEAGAGRELPKLDLYPILPQFTNALNRFKAGENRSYDLVFSHYWLSGRVGGWIQRLWRIPHLAMFHTLGRVKNAVGVGPQEPGLRTDTEMEVAANCDRIIAATEREKRELVTHYHAWPGKIGVVPCGVNMRLFRPIDRRTARKTAGMNMDEKVILFVGRIDPLKGLDRLVRAMSRLEHPEGVRLVVVGGDDRPGEEFLAIKKLIRDLGIWDSIDFKGRVPHDELPFYYSAADVMAVPSHHESFGLVALEALACGTPVVSTRVGGMDRIIQEGKNGFLVSEDVPRNLAQRIGGILARGREAWSPESIRNSVSDYSWSNVAAGIIEEYQVLIEDKAA